MGLLDIFAGFGAAAGLGVSEGRVTGHAATLLSADAAGFGIPPGPTATLATRLRWVRSRLSQPPEGMLHYGFLHPYDAGMGFKASIT